MSLTQENRALNIDTPLGKDVLLLTGLNGTEGISAPFSYQLDMISAKQDIEYSRILGKSVNVSIELADGGKRIINGIITRFAKGDAGVTDPGSIRTYPYQATLQPTFRLLSLTGDCKIFQNLAAPKIVEKVFQEHKIKYRSDLEDTYPTREYCVQYNESDFTFISRILEEEGIYYYFEHEENQHTLVLVERNEQVKPCPDQAIMKYSLNLEGTAEEDTVTSLECEQYVGPTGFAIKDFNFNTPHADLLSTAPTMEKFTDMDLELYCYPGDFDNKAAGMRLVDMRMEEEEAHSAVIAGSSSCRALQSGYHFDLRQFYRTSMNSKKYLVTSVRHVIAQSFEDGGDFQYSNTFTCIPLTVKYRPMRTTHKPVMQGSQTATVTGPKGEEIHVDHHGRVKIQFHWDRYGQRDDNTSCWVRVSYPSSGTGFGFQTHPRIGDEVIVDFLEGDPDRPIITGAVYNGANPSSNKLPDNKTVSVLRTNSTPGGGGFNEIRLEDKKGSEDFALHAQKDMNTIVGNDRNTTVKNNRTTSVMANDLLNVNANRLVNIKGMHTTSVDANQTVNVKGERTLNVDSNQTHHVKGNRTLNVDADQTNRIKGNHTLNVDTNRTVHVKGKVAETIDTGREVIVTAGHKETITGGVASAITGDFNRTVTGPVSYSSTGKFDICATAPGTYTSGTSLTLAVEDSVVQILPGSITITAGGSTLKLDASGISLNGAKISLNG